MPNDQVAGAIQQIEIVMAECESLLERIKGFSPPDEKGIYPETFRLIATPMLYSAWERCFTLCHAIAFRLIRDVTAKACDLDAPQRGIWLLNSPFYRSLVDQLRRDYVFTRTGKGEYSLLCEFLPKLDDWLNNGLDQALNIDDLVMTFSNVNPCVVELNAQAIGIANFTQFKELKTGLLHDLVGARNDIGHGASIEPPTNERFTILLDFTETLVKKYFAVFIQWLETTFADNEQTE